MRNLIYVFFSALLLLVSCTGKSLHEENQPEEETHAHTNALINETSPYLQQHAHNPVDWMPWGQSAFDKAAADNKLVLISIGYSSCHWCHVMEKESFEDEEVAEFMNENFVCIKVDREERPDVDQIYMEAVQMMTGSGGWPLNCFTLPDGRPFYGGTYFPKEQWLQTLKNLDYNYEKSPEEIESFANNLTNGIQNYDKIEAPAPGAQFSMTRLDSLMEGWTAIFDKQNGGNRQNIKFPLPSNYDFMMQYAYHTEDEEVMNHVDLTLEKMALGGIYDQVGGGFSRYSTDNVWKVPHFEKMLYDNAQLVSLYARAYQRNQNPLYKHVVYQTLEWAWREMMTNDGAFYSALDADSDGEEGKFYVWEKEELESVLGEADYDFVKSYYQIGPKSKWEGKFILLRGMTNEAYAQENGYTPEELEEKVTSVNERLLEARSERIRPGLDDKSLTSWNALMQIALLDAYAVFGEELFLKGAMANAHWITKYQMDENGKLFHSFKGGKASIEGFLEDYSFTIEAFIRMYEATFDETWLEKADQLAHYAKTHFYDEKSGMFYFSSDEEASLIARKMEIADNVIPASNSSMANALYDLGILLDKKEYKDMSKQMLSNVYDKLVGNGMNYSNWAILSMNLSNPYYEIAITGKEWKSMQQGLNKTYVPNRLYMGAEKKSDLPILEGKFMGETTIFVCIEGACKMPTNTVEAALEQMDF